MAKKNWKLRGRVYIFVRQYMHEHDHAPTGAEIAAGVHCNRHKVYGYLRDLAERDMLVLTGGYRGIELPQKD